MKTPGTTALRGLVVALALAAPAGALTIRHQHTDIADASGQDRWRSEFYFEDSMIGIGQGFTLLFDPASHAALTDVSIAGPDWDLIVLQPDTLLPASGVFDGLALADMPDLSGPFQIEFTWLGAGTPGAMPFVYYDIDFQALEAGETVPVPEPGTSMLVALGLVCIGGSRRRSPRKLRREARGLER